MDFKPTIEQFINNCFRERTAALKLASEISKVYRRRFYHGDCCWESGRWEIEQSEAEKILSISPSDIGTTVATTGSTIYRSRYHVKSSGERWLIHEIDIECAHCHVNGVSTECTACGGTGWRSTKDLANLIQLAKRGEKGAARITSLSPEEELGGSLYRDAAIEQFMTEHFRERTTVVKKAVEIHAAYRKRFYSPDCDWDSNEGSVQSSEAERIVNIVPIETGVHVMTLDYCPFRLRYDLRPEGKSWLIWEVDVKCPRCNDRGKSTDCYLCGGTGWANGKGKVGFTRGEPPDEETPPENPRLTP